MENVSSAIETFLAEWQVNHPDSPISVLLETHDPSAFSLQFCVIRNAVPEPLVFQVFCDQEWKPMV